MKNAIVFSISVALMLGGCVNTDATRLSATANYPATTPASVSIYRSRLDVPGDYTEIALLDSDANAIYSDYGQLYNSMRKKAAAMGANGILLGETTEPSPLTKLAAVVLDGTARRQVTAIAIFVQSQPVFLAPAKKRK